MGTGRAAGGWGNFDVDLSRFIYPGGKIRELADRLGVQRQLRCKREIKAIYNVSSDGIVYTRYY